MSKKNCQQQYESTTEQPEKAIELQGVIEETLPGTWFKVKCDAGNYVLATLSGRLRQNKIRLLIGDRVRVEVSPYDLTRGRVSYRMG